MSPIRISACAWSLGVRLIWITVNFTPGYGAQCRPNRTVTSLHRLVRLARPTCTWYIRARTGDSKLPDRAVDQSAGEAIDFAMTAFVPISSNSQRAASLDKNNTAVRRERDAGARDFSIPFADAVGRFPFPE